MGVNKLSKGQVAVGKLIGTIQAAAGSIGSTELAASAVTTAKIAAGAVTDPKVTRSVATPNSTVAVTGHGYKIVTAPGSSAGKVYTIGDPTLGDHFTFFATGTIGGSSAPVCIKSTAATFDGTNVVAKFQVTNNYLDIVASSTTRWLAKTNGSTGVVYAATT